MLDKRLVEVEAGIKLNVLNELDKPGSHLPVTLCQEDHGIARAGSVT